MIWYVNDSYLETGQIGGRLKLLLVRKQQSLAVAEVRRAFDRVCGLGMLLILSML